MQIIQRWLATTAEVEAIGGIARAIEYHIKRFFLVYGIKVA